MNLQTSKLLGGIGALTIFLSAFTIFVRNISPIINTAICGSLFVLSGSMFVLISLYSLAKIYKDKKIFTNALYGALTTIIGIIISIIVAIRIIQPIIINLMQQTSQIVKSNPDDIISGFLNNIDTTFILQIINGIVVVYYVMCLFIIIAMIFTYRSLKKLAQHSHTNLFATTGFMLIIGAVTSLFFIGLLLLWISTLILAIAFFTLKKPNTTTTTTPSPLNTTNFTPSPSASLQSTTNIAVNTQTKAYCPYCGTPTPPENVYCHHCGKQQ